MTAPLDRGCYTVDAPGERTNSGNMSISAVVVQPSTTPARSQKVPSAHYVRQLQSFHYHIARLATSHPLDVPRDRGIRSRRDDARRRGDGCPRFSRAAVAVDVRVGIPGTRKSRNRGCRAARAAQTVPGASPSLSTRATTGGLPKSLILERFSSSQIQCTLTSWRRIKHER